MSAPNLSEATAILQQVLSTNFPSDTSSSKSSAATKEHHHILFSSLTSLEDALRHDSSDSLTSTGPSIKPVLTTAFNLSTGELLLTPIRSLLVSCTVLLYNRCNRVDVFGFIKDLCETASLTAKSQKSLNGSRLLSVDTLGALISHRSITSRVTGLLNDIILSLSKCSRSTDVNIRMSAFTSVHMICDSLVECSPESKFDSPWVAMKGLEEKELVEVMKMVKKGVEDKNSDVRLACSKLATSLVPLSIVTGTPKNPSMLHHLDELLNTSLVNLDDESVAVGHCWAEAVGVAVNASIAVQKLHDAEATVAAAKREVEDEEASDSNKKKSQNQSSGLSIKFQLRKGAQIGEAVTSCKTSHESLSYLTSWFKRVGGEAGVGLGGAYSVGGRAVRQMIAVAMSHILRLQVETQTLLKSGSNLNQILMAILELCDHSVFEKTSGFNLGGLSGAPNTPGSPPGNTGFAGSSPSPAPSSAAHQLSVDVKIAQLATNNVLRSLGSTISEPMQLNLLQELSALFDVEDTAHTNDPSLENTTPPRRRSRTKSIVSRLNQQQIQCSLIEISHLISALDEASIASTPALLATLQTALGHKEHGVRFEAATCLSTISRVFSSKSFEFLEDCVAQMRLNFTEVTKLSTQTTTDNYQRELYIRMYKINGYATAVAMLLQEIGGKVQEEISNPNKSNSNSNDVFDDKPFHPPLSKKLKGYYETILTFSSQLLDKQFNAELSKLTRCFAEKSINNTLMCTCTRAAYTNISALLSLGPAFSKKHIGKFFGLWQTSVEHAKKGRPEFEDVHDLICLDACLQSILSFTRNCPTLLLDIPDALTRTSILLESVLECVSGEGRLAQPNKPSAISRLDIIKASLMEAFSWMPPGSFPTVADQLFGWACDHIKIGSEAEVQNSLLTILLDSEDAVLDVCSYSSAKITDEVGEDSTMLDTLAFKQAIIIDHAEREALLHGKSFFHNGDQNNGNPLSTNSSSSIHSNNVSHYVPPTPMHAAGNWKPPPSPFGSSSIRLMDCCIHMFAALFGLQDSENQVKAVTLLSTLLPAAFQSSKSSFNPTASISNTFTSEAEKNAKASASLRLSANIVSTLLSITQALPVHEGNHASDMPWISKASEILLALLASPLSLVRRGSAQALGLLCTRVKGNLLQEVVESLQHVLDGQFPNGKKRSDSIAGFFAKSGAVLALANIGKGGSNNANTSQFITMCLERAVDAKEAQLVRTWSLYSVGSLLDHVDLGVDASAIRKHLHLISDVVDMLLGRFLGDWLVSRGEGVAAMVRLMNILLPIIFELDPTHPAVATLCSIMNVAKEFPHASVLHECLKFLELIAVFDVRKVNSTDSLEFLLGVSAGSHFGSGSVIKTAISCMRAFAMSMRNSPEVIQSLNIHSSLLVLLDKVQGRANCVAGDFYRGVAVPRTVEKIKCDETQSICHEIRGTMDILLDIDGRYLHALLFCRGVIRGEKAVAIEADVVVASDDEEEEDKNENIEEGWTRIKVVKAARHRALVEAGVVTSSPSRWQVKRQATNLAFHSLKKLTSGFDVKEARAEVEKKCASSKPTDVVMSYPGLHCEDIIAAACTAATATSGDNLVLLQTSGLEMLSVTLEKFTGVKDPDSITSENVLTTLTSQVTAAVKPALSAGGIGGYNVPWLEKAVECLVIISCELEAKAIKRLIKPVISRDGSEAIEKVAQIVVGKGDWGNEIVGDRAEFFEELEKLILRNLSDNSKFDEKTTTLATCLAIGGPSKSVSISLSCAIVSLKEVGISYNALKILEVLVDNKASDFRACLSEVGEEVLSVCCDILRWSEGGADDENADLARQGLTTIGKILALKDADFGGEETNGEVGIIVSVLAAMAAKRGFWDVWSSLPSDVALRSSIEEVKVAISKGAVSLKVLSAGVEIGVLMGYLGVHIVTALLEAGRGREKDRAVLCTECVRTLLLGYQSIVAGGGEVKNLLGELVPVFVLLIKHNGLPNGFLKPVGNVGAEGAR
ncbi:hypothetical protein TL16_g06779 [Triparma laevis f. inornata]|uniref:Uncharacterized protein n=1 Tax=Triparma laevis f. inornata TaxID=1714386 RepID=A0A9W7EG84_9STRA|nr:hypothetical protein TL16_g06779 [Triparma laevis f. inornata]